MRDTKRFIPDRETRLSMVQSLTAVEARTPSGELLRRYWHPFALASDVTRTKPTRRVRLLAEDLVLFRGEGNQFGLLPENCPHRGASLYYGFVEGQRLRCPYHGWLFDSNGGCVQRPFESKPPGRNSNTTGFLVRELGGILFAYLGPRESAPALPRWDILDRTDGERYVEVQEDIACNWLQVQENAVDVTHTFYLHAAMFKSRGKRETSGFGRPLKQYGFQPFPWGIVKSWVYEGQNGVGWGNPLIFPNALRIETEMHWRVPLDNLTTRIFWVGFKPLSKPTRTVRILRQKPRRLPNGDHTMDTFMSQDAMAWETQGAVFDRGKERLGASDIGITMFRRMLLAALRDLKAGRALPASMPAHEAGTVINLREWMNGYLPMSCAPDPTPVRRRVFEEVFDGRHRIVRLP